MAPLVPAALVLQQLRVNRDNEGLQRGRFGNPPDRQGLLRSPGSLRYRYFLDVGSETPIPRTIEATFATTLPSFLISPIRFTLIISLQVPIVANVAATKLGPVEDDWRPSLGPQRREACVACLLAGGTGYNSDGGTLCRRLLRRRNCRYTVFGLLEGRQTTTSC